MLSLTMNPKIAELLLSGYTIQVDSHVPLDRLYIINDQKSIICSTRDYLKIEKARSRLAIQDQFNNDLDSLLKD